MVKWYFKIVFPDGTFGFETFRAKDKLEAYAKVKEDFPDAKEYIKLNYDDYLVEIGMIEE